MCIYIYIYISIEAQRTLLNQRLIKFVDSVTVVDAVSYQPLWLFLSCGIHFVHACMHVNLCNTLCIKTPTRAHAWTGPCGHGAQLAPGAHPATQPSQQATEQARWQGSGTARQPASQRASQRARQEVARQPGSQAARQLGSSWPARPRKWESAARPAINNRLTGSIR